MISFSFFCWDYSYSPLSLSKFCEFCNILPASLFIIIIVIVILKKKGQDADGWNLYCRLWPLISLVATTCWQHISVALIYLKKNRFITSKASLNEGVNLWMLCHTVYPGVLTGTDETFAHLQWCRIEVNQIRCFYYIQTAGQLTAGG